MHLRRRRDSILAASVSAQSDLLSAELLVTGACGDCRTEMSRTFQRALDCVERYEQAIHSLCNCASSLVAWAGRRGLMDFGSKASRIS